KEHTAHTQPRCAAQREVFHKLAIQAGSVFWRGICKETDKDNVEWFPQLRTSVHATGAAAAALESSRSRSLRRAPSCGAATAVIRLWYLRSPRPRRERKQRRLSSRLLRPLSTPHPLRTSSPPSPTP